MNDDALATDERIATDDQSTPAVPSLVEIARPRSDVEQEMTSGLQSLAECERLNEALDKQIVAVGEATSRDEEDAATLARAETDRLLELDEDKEKAATARVKRALAAKFSSSQDRDREVRIEAEQRKRLAAAENNLAAEIQVMERIANQHASDVVLAIAEALRRSAQPLIDELRRASVLQLAVHDRQLGQMLAEVLLPDPASSVAPTINGNRYLVDGRYVETSAGWRDDEALVEAYRLASAPRELLSRLRAYKPRVERESKSPASRERRGITLEGFAPLEALPLPTSGR